MENGKLKTIASHTVAIVIGITFAVFIKSPRVEVIDVGVHEVHEVPVEKIVIKEVIKYKTEVVREYVCNPFLEEIRDALYSNFVVHHVILDKEHRLSLLAGMGPRKEFVFGAGYAFNITNAYSLGVSVLNNKTYITSFGLDF